jgi:hypothetical protein
MEVRDLKTLRLTPHPSTPGPAIEIAAGLRPLDEQLCVFRYEVTGAVTQLVLPTPKRGSPTQRDGLWQRTCFEAFSRRGGQTEYREFNFSPSGDWAVYAFHGYRKGMSRPAVGQELTVAVIPTAGMLVIEGIVRAQDLNRATQFGLSAVIEEVSGTKSYWALAHPPGDKPDFHHPDCFALDLSPEP